MPTRPPVHAPPWARAARQAAARERELRRGSSYDRGYDRRWQRVRLGFLQDHPLCMDCDAKGIVTVATEAHHVAKVADRPELRLDPANLRALCHDCHAIRTGRGE
jgi:5-methylcytosine-specific restriction protein A